ncbi:MAG: rRNA maturation RNase YbeY [Bacteroidota bacterium]
MFTNFEIMSTKIKKEIRFFFLSQGITLRNRNRLKKYLINLCKAEGKNVEFINYIFCSDEYLLQINQDYLRHNYYTDIITFDLSESHKALQAEIYISVDRVRENAERLGVSLRFELHRVIFHGVLHLCGYGDKTERERQSMRELEDLHLEKYE